MGEGPAIQHRLTDREKHFTEVWLVRQQTTIETTYSSLKERLGTYYNFQKKRTFPKQKRDFVTVYGHFLIKIQKD